MIIPITIHGLDTSGQAFRENTWTIGINKQGARIATFHPLPLGGQISVVNPVLGRSAKAKVIWVGEKRFPEDPYEVGVELAEAQNVWGIKFPPEDWQKPSPAARGVRAPEPAGEAVSAPAAEKAVAPEPGKPRETSKAAETPAAPKEPVPPSEELNQFNLALAALSHFSQQAEVIRRPETLAGEPAKPAPAIDSQTRAGLQQVANLLEELQQREKSLRLIEERLNTQARRLEASRDQVEALLTRTEEAGRNWQAELEKARSSIQEASRQAFDSALEKSAQQLIGRLTQALEDRARSSSLNAERTLQEKSEKLLARIQEEASSASLKIQQKSEQEAEETRRIIERRVDWAVDSLNGSTGAATAKLDNAYRRVEADFKALEADYPQKLAELSSSGLEGLRQKTQSLLADFQAQLQKTFSEFQERRAREVTQELQKKSDELLELWLKELRTQSGDVLEKLSEQLKASGVRVVEDTKKQLAGITQSAQEAVGREAKATLQTMRALGEKLGDSGKALVDETAKQLGALTRVTVESLTREARTIAQESRDQVRKTLQEFQERGARELEAHLEKGLEQHRETMLKLLEKAAEDSTEQALAQVKSRSEQAVKEASDAVYKQVGVGAVVLKDWADQARTHLENFLQRSAEGFQRQIAGLSEATLEKHRRESEVLVEDLRARLQQAARIFQDKESGPLDTKAPETPEKPGDPSPLERKVEEDSDPVIERLRKQQEEALSEAAQAFRNKLAEMLEGFRLGAPETGERKP
jgi:phosphoribosyl-ATP pyrophosphohydrolase